MNVQAGLSVSVVSENESIPFQGQPPTEPAMERPLSVLELCRKIGEQYGIKKTSPTRTVIPEIPKDISKMSQEQMAVAIAQDMSGKNRLTPHDRLFIGGALYASIKNMIYQIATQYSTTCKDSVDDLAQDCMYRIITQLWRFRPRKGKFTTWTWRVCNGVLNKKFAKVKQLRGVIVEEGCLTNEDGESMYQNMPSQPIEGVQHHECVGVMAAEIVDAVRDLATKHPRHKRLLFEMFGNPDQKDFSLPADISIIDAAKAAGIEYSRARVFYSKVVQPFFKKQFAGC